MKFKITLEVLDKFPNIFIAIPLIYGFENRWDQENRLLVSNLKEECENHIKSKFVDSDEYSNNLFVSSYFEAFQEFGVNPKKVKPTHYALGKRVLEGGKLPTINPIVDTYNSFSIKYITPFGGEDLDNVYGDFVLDLAEGNEHWLGIGETFPKSPKKGDLIWKDDFDVSTLSLNWRQCERTKLTEESKNGYFIMDGFTGINDTNIISVAQEFTKYVVEHYGGSGEVVVLDRTNPFVEIPFESKSIEGIEVPKMSSSEVVVTTKKEKKSRTFVYEAGTVLLDIQKELYSSFEGKVALDAIDVSPTKDSKYGDYTSTVAMRVSKGFGKKPMELAEQVIKKLGGIVVEANALAPGFINMYVKKDLIKEQFANISESYGKLDIGSGKQMMVEFGQPNTHKALQLGHFKSAITGLSIARLYENLGYEVVKANYFGDIGLQVANCLWGVINRNGTWYEKFGKEDLKEIKENLDSIVREKGIDAAALYLDQSYVLGRNQSTNKEKILAQVKDINMKIYERSDDNILALYDYTREISIKHQDKAFKELGVEYDVQYPESKVWELGKQTVLDNVGKVFIEDDGAIIFDGEKYRLQKWVYLTSAGFPSYSGKDLGLAITKFKEYPKLDFAIVTTSVEQNAYFRALIKSLELIDPSFEGKYMHVGFGWLLFENKKMSSKSGKNVKYTDLIAEALEIARSNISDEKGYSDSEREEIARVVAMGALKFAILSHEFHKDINWDINKFMSMNGFAAPYILYTYARGRSVMRNCEYDFNNVDGGLEYDQLYNSDIELDLLRKIGEYKDIVKVAGSNLSPHLLCRYLYELSEIFNRFYGEFNVQNEEDSNIKKGRLRLIYVTTEVIKKGLYLLGIDTVEQM